MGFMDDAKDKLGDAWDAVKDKAEDAGEFIEEKFEDVKDRFDGDRDEDAEAIQVVEDALEDDEA